MYEEIKNEDNSSWWFYMQVMDERVPELLYKIDHASRLPSINHEIQFHVSKWESTTCNKTGFLSHSLKLIALCHYCIARPILAQAALVLFACHYIFKLPFVRLRVTVFVHYVVNWGSRPMKALHATECWMIEYSFPGPNGS